MGPYGTCAILTGERSNVFHNQPAASAFKLDAVWCMGDIDGTPVIAFSVHMAAGQF